MKNTLYTRILVFNYSIIRTFSLTKWTNQDLKFPWGSHTRSSRSLQKSGLTLDLSHCNRLNCLCPCVLWHVPMTPLLVSLCMDPRDCLCGASSCQALWQTQGRRQGRQCCQPHQAPHWVRVPLSCTCRLRSRPHTESATPPPSYTCRLRSRCPCTPGASHTPCWGTDLNTHSSHASGSWGLAQSSPQWLCSGNEQKRADTETCEISV